MKKLIFILCLLFTSCVTCKNYCVKCDTCTDQIIIDSSSHKTDYIVKIDSIYIKDSIFVRVKNDTVFVDRWHWQNKTKIDTIVKIDSVYVDKKIIETNVVEVNVLTLWQKILLWIGGISLIIALIVVVYKLATSKLRAINKLTNILD